MTHGVPVEPTLRLQRLIADGIESGEGRRLTDEIVEDLRERALDARSHRP